MTETLTATLNTNQGQVVIRLFPDHAPKTVTTGPMDTVNPPIMMVLSLTRQGSLQSCAIFFSFSQQLAPQ